MEYKVTISKEDLLKAEERELAILNGMKASREKEYTPVKSLADLPPQIKDRIERRIEHRLIYKWFQEEYGMPEAINKFKVAWHKTPSPYHDLLAKKHYDCMYMELNCKDGAMRKIISDMVTSLGKEELDKAVDGITVEAVTIKVEVK
jgi:hypothetical protein